MNVWYLSFNSTKIQNTWSCLALLCCQKLCCDSEVTWFILNDSKWFFRCALGPSGS